ncbi:MULTISPECIES: type IV secretion system protein [unclassified Sphingopyxis]|jgi:type IV secretion system protein VirB8|uniref:virB8 family protein n=1 Tax=unclassified Sphingopyxis TaxID=2614943 RepID=UPI0028580CFB|nr:MULTISPECIES: type IV secretion system protein [unclassified Sphingopyxis]MDR6834233.1 type IV secretion system protein VirB8 [Sphingopyxis sp. BE122]MDR7226503.1 type IV secretion system protein VirB8 [Sphingopyxis sp. BE259]
MNKPSREVLDAYYAEAGSWAHDRDDALRSSRRTAWWVAGAASVIAVCEALALLFLTPLKTVEPYTLLVDRQTGFVQPLKPLEPQSISRERALTQSFLVQYVIAREGFDINSVQSDYQKVSLWSDGAARNSYLSEVQVSNPDSPLVRLPRSSLIGVQVKSVTPMSDDTAMVRFDTQRRDAGGQAAPGQPWVAIVRYGYSGEPMSVADRMINPLGFKVTSYRKSAEALAAPAPATAVVVGTPTTARTTQPAQSAGQPIPSRP